MRVDNFLAGFASPNAKRQFKCRLCCFVLSLPLIRRYSRNRRRRFLIGRLSITESLECFLARPPVSAELDSFKPNSFRAGPNPFRDDPLRYEELVCGLFERQELFGCEIDHDGGPTALRVA